MGRGWGVKTRKKWSSCSLYLPPTPLSHSVFFTSLLRVAFRGVYYRNIFSFSVFQKFPSSIVPRLSLYPMGEQAQGYNLLCTITRTQTGWIHVSITWSIHFVLLQGKGCNDDIILSCCLHYCEENFVNRLATGMCPICVGYYHESSTIIIVCNVCALLV